MRWLIANWLSGYYHAKRNNSIIDLESFENNVNKLNNYCYDEKNFKVPIMEAVERGTVQVACSVRWLVDIIAVIALCPSPLRLRA